LSNLSKNNNKKITCKKNNGGPKARWIYKVLVLTFGLSVFFSFISETLMDKLNVILSFFILSCIVFIGIIFDIIGIAVTSAEETPFHAMAAHKIPGGKEGVRLIRNADIVSNFCNDVIGDISGIISGAAGASIVAKIIYGNNDVPEIIISTLIAGTISTITVGGKALGKSLAIKKSKEIVYKVAYIFHFLKKRFGIELFPQKSGK
jgi:CBS domain containing-hemolysin-like protein